MLNVQVLGNGKVTLAGRLDAAQVEAAQRVLFELDESLEVDLSGLDYISSAGLGMFIALHTRLSKADKELVLINPTDMVRNVFRLSRLDQLLDLR